MRTRAEAVDRLRHLQDMPLSEYERGYVRATLDHASWITVETLKDAVHTVERRMAARGVKVK